MKTHRHWLLTDECTVTLPQDGWYFSAKYVGLVGASRLAGPAPNAMLVLFWVLDFKCFASIKLGSPFMFASVWGAKAALSLVALGQVQHFMGMVALKPCACHRVRWMQDSFHRQKKRTHTTDHHSFASTSGLQSIHLLELLPVLKSCEPGMC